MKSVNVIKEIKSVISVQAKSLNKARIYITPVFSKAVNAIYKCQGKIIVTGIGKSGLVAQKIASTLSSTGTPAIYLHPVEGMHGNLGVVHKNDIVFAIGKSGESEEILNILPTIKKIGAKIISLTSSPHSSLAKKSTIALHVPIKREACPLNLAPTTSSTVSLVIGDAIAITLMKKREFAPENFALYHPGGQLGKRLSLKVSDIMRSGKKNPVVKLKSSMDRLLIEITKKWTGAASIVDDKGRLIGLVTDFDIRKAFAKGKRISDIRISDIMNPRPTFVKESDKAIKAFQIMENRNKPLTILSVVNDKKKVVGMIHLHDLIEKGLVNQPT